MTLLHHGKILLLMSEMGQKRTLPPCFRMAALPLKADLIADVLGGRLGATKRHQAGRPKRHRLALFVTKRQRDLLRSGRHPSTEGARAA